jgi:hypothetical protein
VNVNSYIAGWSNLFRIDSPKEKKKESGEQNENPEKNSHNHFIIDNTSRHKHHFS